MKEYNVSVRKTNGLEIWFIDPQSIYVKNKYGWTLFTRWDVKEKGFWTKNWNPFRRVLKDQRHIDLGMIIRHATMHNIGIRYASGLPSRINEDEARIIPEKGRNRNNY